MKLRITDARTHAVEFEAENERQLRLAAIQGAAEFPAGTFLEIHVWDGEAWAGVRRSGSVAPLVVTQRQLFAGAPLWGHVEASYHHARKMIDGCRELKAWIRRSCVELVK
ncbi:hypothetical protein Q2E61_09145 [Microbulbifer thermotolerans]|uniref:hypothetical protein n=1 Tax=Microbulbifer thermotolerans TaxID=252514 RepID=UPI0026722357|nr:hypothetical protein [Microbulbifer thermotolerans]WKT59092.1 hypothetical protein Q2E61_09145 [Microbulbifer thermotolerans]